MLQASKTLLSGRSAKEWLKLHSHNFYDLIHKKTKTELSLDSPIPKDFARMVDKDVWRKIDKAFFRHKEMKKVRLRGKEDIYSTPKKGAKHP